MQILDLQIDFPEIDGYSDKQKWFAENLREEYVRENEGRFREIEQIVQEELDYRMKNDYNGHTRTWEEVFTNEEMACLFGEDAGGVIATLKLWREEKRKKD